MSEAVTLTGTALDVRVFKDSWGVLTLRSTGERADLVRVTGDVADFGAGDLVEVRGSFFNHPRYGRQLKAVMIALTLPDFDDEAAVVGWLSANLLHVGPKRARVIVDRFPGEELWRVLEEEPERLLEVSGITEARLAPLLEAYARAQADREVQIQLHAWGVPLAKVQKWVKTYRTTLQDAKERIEADPFWLLEIPSITFSQADAVASAMGLDLEDPRRVRAGIVYAIRQVVRVSGHVWVQRSELGRALDKLMIYGDAIDRGTDELLAEGRLYTWNNAFFTTTALRNAERDVARFLSARRGRQNERGQVDAGAGSRRRNDFGGVDRPTYGFGWDGEDDGAAYRVESDGESWDDGADGADG